MGEYYVNRYPTYLIQISHLKTFALGANVTDDKRDNPLGFSSIGDLPPTEEVSDNELETIDDLNENIGKSNFENYPHGTSDNTVPTLDLPFDPCNHTNTYSHQKFPKEPLTSSINQGVQDSISEKCNQQLSDSEHSRPSYLGIKKGTPFSPHSPVSSPELNELEDIGSNSPAAFSSKTNCETLYAHSNIDRVQYPNFVSHRLTERSDKQSKCYNQAANQEPLPYLKKTSPVYLGKEIYNNYSNSDAVIPSPERRDQYTSHIQRQDKPYYNRFGSETELNEQYRSPNSEKISSHFEPDIMARDRHSNNHRSENYDSREQKSRYHRDSENDHYEANSKYSRRQRSISSDRNSHQDKSDIMHKKRDRKSKKSKKSKKDKRYRDYRTGSKKSSRGEEDYNDMDGSPFSSDPDIEGRNSRSSHRHSNRNRAGRYF